MAGRLRYLCNRGLEEQRKTSALERWERNEVGPSSEISKHVGMDNFPMAFGRRPCCMRPGQVTAGKAGPRRTHRLQTIASHQPAVNQPCEVLLLAFTSIYREDPAVALFIPSNLSLRTNEYLRRLRCSL